MKHFVFALVYLVFIGTPGLQAGPAPYSSAKIYILDLTGLSSEPTADYIRKYPDYVIEVKEAIVDWFASLHWENHKHDPTIKDKAKPLVMIIDLYDRVQPEPPEKPQFDTLYCSKNYAYSTEGEYIDISYLVSKRLLFPIQSH